MTSLLALMLGLGLVHSAAATDEAEGELSVDIHVQELKAHVYRLSSPEFLGRSGPGAARNSRHLAAAFEKLKLQPAFANPPSFPNSRWFPNSVWERGGVCGDSYFQPIPWHLADDGVEAFVGRNVGAVLPGSDPELKEEWIILSAHYDHLGVYRGRLYPGADDNASGVAMLLEVAERLALQEKKPRRTILFVAFDLEEAGLQGSTHFATHPPRDIHKLKAFLTADMLGRSMANVMDDYVYALGSESTACLRKLLEDVKPEDGLKIGRLGADIVGTRSDYGPFRDRRIPFLFFSTGQHPDYHKPTDTPERIDYEKLRKISLWISDLTMQLASETEAPAWNDKGAQPDLEEVHTLLTLLQRVLAHPDKCPLAADQREMASAAEKRLSAIAERGTVSNQERSWLVSTSRLLLINVFQPRD